MQSAVSSFSSPAIGGAGFRSYLWRSGKRDEKRRDSSACFLAGPSRATSQPEHQETSKAGRLGGPGDVVDSVA